MAIEELLSRLVDAIEKNTAVTETLTALRTEAVETVREAASPKKAASAKSSGDTKSSKSEEKASAAAPEPKSQSGAEAADPGADLPELIASYVGGTDRENERVARKEKIRKLFRHPKICKAEKVEAGAPYDVTDIMPDAIGLFREQIRLLIDNGDLTQPEEAGNGLLGDL